MIEISSITSADGNCFPPQTQRINYANSHDNHEDRAYLLAGAMEDRKNFTFHAIPGGNHDSPLFLPEAQEFLLRLHESPFKDAADTAVQCPLIADKRI